MQGYKNQSAHNHTNPAAQTVNKNFLNIIGIRKHILAHDVM
jgi:hypothetical protein